MSETSEMEILPPEEVVEIEDKAARKVGFKTLGAAAVLAALCGSVGGAALSTVFNKAVPNIAPLEGKLEALAKENTVLKTQISQLQKEVKTTPKTPLIDLSAIRSRLATLEDAEPQALDADLIARLEALNSEGSEALDLSDIYVRLETLENRPAIIERLTTPETLEAESLPAFPKADILKHLDAASNSESWLQKTLNKHISVQSEDNPRYLVELIEADIKKGDMRAAMMKFDKLPDEAKAAAENWRNALERQ